MVGESVNIGRVKRLAGEIDMEKFGGGCGYSNCVFLNLDKLFELIILQCLL